MWTSGGDIKCIIFFGRLLDMPSSPADVVFFNLQIASFTLRLFTGLKKKQVELRGMLGQINLESTTSLKEFVAVLAASEK